MKSAISTVLPQVSPETTSASKQLQMQEPATDKGFETALKDSQSALNNQDKKKVANNDQSKPTDSADPKVETTSGQQAVKPAPSVETAAATEESAVLAESPPKFGLEDVKALVQSLKQLLGNSDIQKELETVISPEELESLLINLEQAVDVAGGQLLPLSPEVQDGQFFPLSPEEQDVQFLPLSPEVQNGQFLSLSPEVLGQLNSIKQALLGTDEALLLNNAGKAAEQLLTKLDTLLEQSVQPATKAAATGELVDNKATLVGNSLTENRLSLERLQARQEIGNTELQLDGVFADKVKMALKDLQDIHSNLLRHSGDTNTNSLTTQAQNPLGPLKAQLSLPTPFQQAEWGQGVAERVMWMSSQGLNEAEIHLDPPELGPLQVKVSVANEQAHVSFVVQHGSVREALDQHSMRLKEMFDAEGIELVDVDVSDQSQTEDDGDDNASSGSLAQRGDEAADGEEPTIATAQLNGAYGLVNTYV